jgi:hypothetical protein
MKRLMYLAVSLSIAVVIAYAGIVAVNEIAITHNAEADDSMSQADKLFVLWTSADRDVALKMVYMYVYNAKKQGWWDEVEFCVWGPSSKLLAEDAELQEYIAKMKDEGIILTACKACADSYGVTEKLESLGIDVIYMGQPLTERLKGEWKTMTF